MKAPGLILLLVMVAALCVFIEMCSQAVFWADRRAAIAEDEERACLAQSFRLADACEHALDTCTEMLAGVP